MSLLSPTAIASPNFVPGIGTRIIFENAGVFTAFAVESADIDWNVDNDDITHSEANSWQSFITGIKRMNFTISFVYDLANKPLLAPYGLVPGATAKLHLVLDANPTPGNPTPTATQDFTGNVLFDSFKFSAGPKNTAVRVTATGKSTGAFTVPTT